MTFYDGDPPDTVLIHENEDGEEPLHIYARCPFPELLMLRQGEDMIIIPVADLEEVMARLMGVAMAAAR